MQGEALECAESATVMLEYETWHVDPAEPGETRRARVRACVHACIRACVHTRDAPSNHETERVERRRRFRDACMCACTHTCCAPTLARMPPAQADLSAPPEHQRRVRACMHAHAFACARMCVCLKRLSWVFFICVTYRYTPRTGYSVKVSFYILPQPPALHWRHGECTASENELNVVNGTRPYFTHEFKESARQLTRAQAGQVLSLSLSLCVCLCVCT